MLIIHAFGPHSTQLRVLWAIWIWFQYRCLSAAKSGNAISIDFTWCLQPRDNLGHMSNNMQLICSCKNLFNSLAFYSSLMGPGAVGLSRISMFKCTLHHVMLSQPITNLPISWCCSEQCEMRTNYYLTLLKGDNQDEYICTIRLIHDVCIVLLVKNYDTEI